MDNAHQLGRIENQTDVIERGGDKASSADEPLGILVFKSFF